jgi:hypothetical protein
MNAGVSRVRLFVAGQLVEFWENSEAPFGLTAEHLAAYARQGSWGLLFNALLLSNSQAPPPLGS